MCLDIKEGAIFVADSHFSKKNQQLLKFLLKIKAEDIKTSQLILMGDMFDFLSGESRYFVKQNIEVINLLNELSFNIQIVYLEGNHDYNLQVLFPKIHVIKRENQPLFATFQNKSVALSHGDNFINWKYDLYCKFIRNKIFLKFMNFIDFKFVISKKIGASLLKKNICHKINNFENLVVKRVSNYKVDIIIEGHYHQGNSFFVDNKKYINIPSLCCDNSYIKIEEFNFLGKKV